MEAGRCVEEAAAALVGLGLQPRAAVVGVGGAGGTIVSILRDREMAGVDLVAVNGDARSLAAAEADVKVLLTGPSPGAPEAARALAEAHWDRFVSLLNHDIVIVVAGLGGATGSGAAPVVVQAARANGATVVVVALLPFEAEGRSAIAAEALAELRVAADASVVLANESLARSHADLPFRHALAALNLQVVGLLQGMVERVASAVVGPTPGDLLDAALGSADLGLPPDARGVGDDVPPLALGAGGLIL